jgi:uncharacterized membrane protein
MTSVSYLSPSGDMSPAAIAVACALAVASLAMLLVEMRLGRRGGWLVAATGLLAVASLLCAVLRPARVQARETVVGARVLVLADESRSMALPGDDGRARRFARDKAIAELEASGQGRGGGGGTRFVVLGFGEGPAAPMPAAAAAGEGTARAARSDLGAALRSLAAAPEERPAAIVVVSDGRLDDPSEESSAAALRSLGDALHVPIHAVATTRESPSDASIRRVSAAGVAVVHVPLPVRVEVGCAGGLECGEVTVTARELRDDGPPVVLASGVAHVVDGKAALDLTIVLHRIGSRIVEFAISPQAGDAIPENDRRLVTFQVARERVRLLHVAGRPTNDVRALRRWIKSDASADVVAFFILRTKTDEVRASPDELALIPFPVDDLFQDYLPTFDAIILQDFDAQPYGLEKYLENIRRYVRRGGGLVMVGGENSFVAGGYAGTPLADVLPVGLDGTVGATGADASPFVPEYTNDGAASPILAGLREALGGELPTMPGANLLGDVKPGALALWSHPTRTTRSGAKMPVLAIGEQGDGRSIALGVDGAWELEFSALGARTAGRGHGALWDGLLGWLMRDPRFESAQLEIVGGCMTGEPALLRARLLTAGRGGEAMTLDVARVDVTRGAPVHLERVRPADTATVDFPLPPLEAGGYTAHLRVEGGATTRYDFACEAGGDEWADSRPDPARLERLAKANGGSFVDVAGAGSLRLPEPTTVNAERHVAPLAPPWAWTTVAAMLLGAHWVARRRGGLS